MGAAAAAPTGTAPITGDRPFPQPLPAPMDPAVPAHEIPISAIARTSDGRQDRNGIAELAGSIKAIGLLNPIVVRERKSGYELAAGRRRIAAAELLGWTEIPAFVRVLTDDQMVVIRIVENDQREDAHPLDQAENYQQLRKLGHSNHAIAEMVSRPESHVYDRLRLSSLIPAAQQLFRAGRIGLGHAIKLSRCKAKDQERAIAPPNEDRMGRETGLWRSETVSGDLFEEEEKRDPLAGYHACTEVELQDWIDHHVRFDRDAPDVPQLFEATAANMTAAVEKREKIIPITHQYHLQPDARAKERTYGPQSWKLADGSKGYDGRIGGSVKSKTCERSALGVVVAGDGRGDTLRVCIDKACPVHWGQEAKEARKRKKAAASGNETRQANLRRAENARRAKEEAERDRWKKATPKILEALAQACTKADTTPTGLLGQRLIRQASKRKHLSPGKSAESLVRYLGFQDLAELADNWYYGPRQFPEIAKALKIDLKAILEQAAPLAPDAAAKKSKPAKKAKR